MIRDVCYLYTTSENCYKYIQKTGIGVSMLFTNGNAAYVYRCLLALMVFMGGCASYAYRVNARRTEDDPKKRDFRIGAVLLAPFTWLLFIFASITLFIIKVIIYTALLILFIIAFIIVRKPFLFIWLHKIAITVGDALLEANMLLIRIFLSKKVATPPTT